MVVFCSHVSHKVAGMGRSWMRDSTWVGSRVEVGGVEDKRIWI